MIRRIGIIYFILLFIGCNTPLKGQEFIPTPVEISSEKSDLNGESVYVHRVLKGQTLFSVSKAYNVSIDRITELNPSLKDGLKSGSVIYIPVISTDVPVTDTVATTPPPPSKDKKYKKHTTKWYENIYDVAQRYNVPVDALIAINGLGENTVLNKRQVLVIPDDEYITEYRNSLKRALMSTPKKDFGIAFPADTTKPADTAAVSEVMESPEVLDLDIYKKNNKRTYKISLVLPFNTKAGMENVSTNQMDFYAGALVAFNDFIKVSGNGLYQLNVVDLNDYQNVYSMMISGVLDNSEFIIGPIFEKDLAPLASWADDKKIPLISPLDPKAAHLAENHPFFFQYPTTQERLLDVTFDSVAEESKRLNAKPLVIYEKWTGKSNMVTSAKAALDSRGVEIDTLSYGILEGRGIDTIMVKMMDTTRVNTVFVVSENEAYVSDVLRNLQLAEDSDSDMSISLYGYPKWKNFEIIELSYFHNLDTHISQTYNIDYHSPKTNAFISNFRYNFQTDPTQYAFQGYDIMFYFLSALNEYGRDFPAYIHLYQKSLLQSNIRFEKAYNKSGFTNQGVRNILYSENWEIKSW